MLYHIIQDEPGEQATKKAVSSIFFPDDYDKKSVLMKRGPTLLDGIDERELFLFTHGFLLSRIEFDSLMNPSDVLNLGYTLDELNVQREETARKLIEARKKLQELRGLERKNKKDNI